MSYQTLNTASSGTGLLLANNITTPDIIIADNQTTGDTYIGGTARTTGSINIGSNSQLGQTLIQSGAGGVLVKAQVGNASLRCDLGGETSVIANGGGILNMDAPLTGSIRIGATQTTGPIEIGNSILRTSDITIGNSSSTGGIIMDGDSVDIGVKAGGTRLISTGEVAIESTGGNQLKLWTRNGGNVSIANINGGDCTISGGATTRYDSGSSSNMIIGSSMNTGLISMGENIVNGGLILGSTGSTTRNQLRSGPGGIELVATGGDVELEGTTINLGADASETVTNINTNVAGTGNVNIGNGSGSVGVSINSGPTDLVDIGWEGGAVNIANNPTGTLDTLIGNATASGNVELATAGNINLTASKVRTLGTAQATTLTNGSAEYKGGIGVTKNIVVGENIILGQDLRADDLTRNLLMFNGNTSGSIAMGGGMTTADISLGAATQTGQIKILPTAESTTTTTGGLICSGGVGIAKRLELGTDLTLGGDINSRVISRDVQMFSANTTGDISIGAGLTTGEILLGKAAMTGQIKSVSTADATSTVNGGFAIAGGLSVAKRLYCDSGIWLGDSKPTTTQTVSITTTVNTGGQRYGEIVTVTPSISGHTFAKFTWTNSLISASSIVLFSTVYNTASNGAPLIFLESQGSGTAVIRVQNVANGTIDTAITIKYVIL